MAQLKVKDLLTFAQELNKQGMSYKEILELPIYLGNDDELNGIHCGWYTNLVDASNPNDEDWVELINEDRCNIELKGKAVVIS